MSTNRDTLSFIISLGKAERHHHHQLLHGGDQQPRCRYHGMSCSDLAILQGSTLFGNPDLQIASCFLTVDARLYLRQQVECLHRHPVPTTYLSV